MNRHGRARDVSPAERSLLRLQRRTFTHFWHEANPENGLLPDNTHSTGVPASIAGVGLALGAYVTGVERGFVTRAAAIGRTLTTLRFFWNGTQSTAADAVGYKGFFYHFLDVKTGRRAWQSELSTIDTTILLAGALTASRYFDRGTPAEREIRDLATALYRRVDWRWAQHGKPTVTHGWTPEAGFLPNRWTGYSEGLLLYLLALGSPSKPVSTESYAAWTSTYQWKKVYGHEFLYAGPLFIHQLSHLWIDFRGVQDDFMRSKGIDYFENSRRATYVQQEYAIRNPRGFVDYGPLLWGLSSSNGPDSGSFRVRGGRGRFMGYRARSVPYGPDDGTLAPWAVVASLPFAPEIVVPTLLEFERRRPRLVTKYGLMCSFNPTYRRAPHRHGWVSNGHFVIDQGPVVLMIENYRSGLIWRLMRQCPFVIAGLKRAGFRGGWLNA